jgi:hypothetical protein
VPGPYAIPADGKGFGRFLFQLDWCGRYGHLPRECPEATPFLQARWACGVLRDAREELKAYREHPLFERAVVARYNASFNAVRAGLDAGDPDLFTTVGPSGRGDYGSDVLARRDRLRAADPARFPPPKGTP